MEKILFYISPHNYYDHTIKKSNNRPQKFTEQFSKDNYFDSIYLFSRVKPRFSFKDNREVLSSGLGYKIKQCDINRNTFFIEHQFPFGNLENLFIKSMIAKIKKKHGVNQSYSVLVSDPKSALVLSYSLGVAIFDAYDDWALSPMYKDNQRHLKAILRGYEAADKYSDYIICNTTNLLKKFKTNRNTVLVTNTSEVPRSFGETRKDVPIKSKKVIGYIGNIFERMDFSLLHYLCLKFSDYEVRLIGKYIGTNVQEREKFDQIIKLENVTYIPGIAYDQVEKATQEFDICMIPHVLDEFTLTQDSMKMYDFLSLGKPIVTTPIPPSDLMQELVYVANDKETFALKIEQAIRENNDLLVHKRIEYMKQNDWSSKTRQIYEVINEVIAR